MADAYGSDTWCADSLQTGRMATGLQNLGLWCYRCLTTPQGTCRGIGDDDEDASFGIDLAGEIGRLDTKDTRGALGPIIRSALMRDDRIRDVAPTIVAETSTAGLTTYTIAIIVLPVAADTALTLTVDASALSVALLGVAT